MSGDDGLLFACLLDGEGGGREIGWSEIPAAWQDDPFVWVHLDHESPGSRRWLSTDSGIDPVVCEALTAEDTRPRSLSLRDGLLVILRGINLNPGADVEDMVSLRMWIESGRAVTLRRRRVIAAQDLRDALAIGSGPRNAGDFLIDVADRLVLRMAGVLTTLGEKIDSLEEAVHAADPRELRSNLADCRRQSVALRRYLAPQRDAMMRLTTERILWLSDIDRARLREIGDRTTRYVEDLDADRDRASITHEELNNRLSEQLNRRMYLLSVIAGIFLPLSFVTGLLGINVGGIPGTQHAWAFLIVCVLLGILGVFQAWLFRRLRLM